MYKLYLDDIRRPLDSLKKSGLSVYLEEWLVVRNYAQFVAAIGDFGLPEIVSFDHDLGREHIDFYFGNGGHENPPDPQSAEFEEKTGYDCAKFLIDYCLDNNVDIPDFLVHSANPVGAENIRALLANYRKWRSECG